MERQKRSLLIVDGSATYLFYLGMLLRRLEYKVRTSATGEDALRLMIDAPPDLVITETMLSKINGISLMAHMKQSPRLKNIPVIIHSAESDPVVLEAYVEAGCTAYVKKPCDPDVLFKAIQAATETIPRQHIRIDTSLRAEIGDGIGGGRIRSEMVTALSEGGLYIATQSPDPVHTIVPLKLMIGDRQVTARAAVHYCVQQGGGQHKHPGMGLKFVSIGNEDQAFLRDYIHAQVEQGLTMETAAPER